MRSVTAGSQPLPFSTKVRLTGRILRTFVRVHLLLRSARLPDVVRRLSEVDPVRADRLPPTRITRAVGRVVLGQPLRARCLVAALIAYRLLREQGDTPALVIGLPDTPTTKDAHAWLEVDGVDVGPPPGRGDHVEMLRYG